MVLSKLRKADLILAPTPLVLADRLSESLGVEIWLKRDDLLGRGLGGNKLRGLEFILGDALEAKCDCLVTGAGVQSNWAMLAALSAIRVGLEPFLVHYGCQPNASKGNQLICDLVNVERRFTGEEDRESVDRGIDRLVQELESIGRRPYPVERGGANCLGSAGYVAAGLEMEMQFQALDIVPKSIWMAAGSCGTEAGLVAAAHHLCWEAAVIGVSVRRSTAEASERIEALSSATMELLSIRRSPSASWSVIESSCSEIKSKNMTFAQDAAKHMARLEGVLLDPVFGAKAFATLVDGIQSGEVEGPVVFLVSGGAPTLFADLGV